jgi:hypothetical protein
MALPKELEALSGLFRLSQKRSGGGVHEIRKIAIFEKKELLGFSFHSCFPDLEMRCFDLLELGG